VRSALLLLPKAAFCFPLQDLNSRPATYAAGDLRDHRHAFTTAGSIAVGIVALTIAFPIGMAIPRNVLKK